jgi:hypothetical protein
MLSMRHWFQMLRIDAPGVLAGVVQIAIFWYRSNPFVISETVRQSCFIADIKSPVWDLSISLTSNPDPAGIFSRQFACKFPETLKHRELGSIGFVASFMYHSVVL